MDLNIDANTGKVILAVILLLITFGYKLFIFKEPKNADYIKYTIELPVNLFSAALSLLFAFFLAHEHDIKIIHVIMIPTYMGVYFITVVILRFAEKKLPSNITKVKITGIILVILNLMISLTAFYFSVKLLLPDQTNGIALKKEISQATCRKKLQGNNLKLKTKKKHL